MAWLVLLLANERIFETRINWVERNQFVLWSIIVGGTIFVRLTIGKARTLNDSCGIGQLGLTTNVVHFDYLYGAFLFYFQSINKRKHDLANLTDLLGMQL
jgi:hypothetical protein